MLPLPLNVIDKSVGPNTTSSVVLFQFSCLSQNASLELYMPTFIGILSSIDIKGDVQTFEFAWAFANRIKPSGILYFSILNLKVQLIY